MAVRHVYEYRVLQLIHSMILVQNVRNILPKEDTNCLNFANSATLERLSQKCRTVHESVTLADHHLRVAPLDGSQNTRYLARGRYKRLFDKNMFSMLQCIDQYRRVKFWRGGDKDRISINLPERAVQVWKMAAPEMCSAPVSRGC